MKQTLDFVLSGRQEFPENSDAVSLEDSLSSGQPVGDERRQDKSYGES